MASFIFYTPSKSRRSLCPTLYNALIRHVGITPRADINSTVVSANITVVILRSRMKLQSYREE